MSLIDNLVLRLQRHPKRVVFPEGSDPRILQAAHKFASKEIGVPILIGDKEKIMDTAKQLDINVEKIRIIEPCSSSDLDDFIRKFQGLRRFRKMNGQEAADYLKNPNYFATLMLATAQADAIISGATSTASSALRPLLQIIPQHSKTKDISSLNILDMDDSETGESRALFLADCAVMPDPNSEQLCNIAVKTAALSYHLTNVTPRVAMLSYTSKSKSSNNPTVAKMKAATELARHRAKELDIPMEIDGELQADAALDPFVAGTKHIENSVTGRANVLIFPDLHAANISLKLVLSLTGIHSYGPILTGLTKPAAEISRSSNANDIFGTAVMVASQAISHKLLYPTEGQQLNKDVTAVE